MEVASALEGLILHQNIQRLARKRLQWGGGGGGEVIINFSKDSCHIEVGGTLGDSGGQPDFRLNYLVILGTVGPCPFMRNGFGHSTTILCSVDLSSSGYERDCG